LWEKGSFATILLLRKSNINKAMLIVYQRSRGLKMKRSLRIAFFIMMVFGGFYLSRGWATKGPATIIFESCTFITGFFGLCALGVLALLSKNK
jgi:hypothetical protein